jgi:predicted nucleotidyltransferase
MPVTEKHKEFLLAKARAMCAENDAELLFLTFSGSTLYGTRIEGKSDLDARGLYLPRFSSLALGNDKRSIRLASGNESEKNSADDFDIDLWSLQYWLLKLLPSGDTGALDLLFSPSNAACTIYRSKVLDDIFAHPLKLIDTANGKTYAEYSMGQAKKYGIKGSHLGALKAVCAFLAKSCPSPSPDERLSDYLQQLVDACGDERFCKIQDVHDYPGLYLCRKLHEGNTRMTEFKKRVETDMNRFGERAKEAERNLGLDFKALSHALRALRQMEELLLTGSISFPLKNRREIMEVNTGKVEWAEIENRLTAMINHVETLQKNAPDAGVPDTKFAESRLLSCYESRVPEPSNASVTERRFNPRFEKGFDVPPDTLNAIYDKLKLAEQVNNVRILHCCESGSRGWNFASRDSDFDVRFIYVHARDWYLSVSLEEKPDTLDLGIEKTEAGELDINGWELRKTLKLLRKPNAPLLERLSSPIVYHAEPLFQETLRSFAEDFFSPIAVWHHYRGLMERSAAAFEETHSIKAFFYVLRPLLCMKWIENGFGLPPMRFDKIADAVVRDDNLKREIFHHIETKKTGGEKDAFNVSGELREFIKNECTESHPPKIQTRRSIYPDIDEFFRKTVNSTIPTSGLL